MLSPLGESAAELWLNAPKHPPGRSPGGPFPTASNSTSRSSFLLLASHASAGSQAETRPPGHPLEHNHATSKEGQAKPMTSSPAARVPLGLPSPASSAPPQSRARTGGQRRLQQGTSGGLAPLTRGAYIASPRGGRQCPLRTPVQSCRAPGLPRLGAEPPQLRGGRGTALPPGGRARRSGNRGPGPA